MQFLYYFNNFTLIKVNHPFLKKFQIRLFNIFEFLYCDFLIADQQSFSTQIWLLDFLHVHLIRQKEKYLVRIKVHKLQNLP
jgi:hypothetical protein